MARTFNCGIGMVAVVARDKADAVCVALTDAGERVHVIGELVARDRDDAAPRVILDGRLGFAS